MTDIELLKQGELFRDKGCYEDAYKCFLEAAMLNNRTALRKLGRCYLRGEGVQQNYEKAALYFDLSKNLNDSNDYDEEDIDCSPEGKKCQFNFTQGLEPMRENVFRYVVEDILKQLVFGDDYLCVAYSPVRVDGISAVQAAKNEDTYYTEIITNNTESKRGFDIYRKSDMTLTEVIAVFRNILVDYMTPDVSGYENVTELVVYIQDTAADMESEDMEDTL